MNSYRRVLIYLAALYLNAAAAAGAVGSGLTDLVDPFIGTGGHGHTYPGASVPFGMVQLSPDTRLAGWDGCSGYHYSDSLVYGFSHTHLSGTGCSDLGDILFAATTGPLRLSNGAGGEPGYRSRFSHSREEAECGYYRVFLEDYGVLAEFTVTQRCGFHRYTFPESENSSIIIDLKHRDRVIESGIRFTGERRVEGFRRSSGWAGDQKVFFAAEFSIVPAGRGVALNGRILEGRRSAYGKNVKGFISFSTGEEERVQVRVGISAVSIEGARRNLEAELTGWDFDGVRERADSLWEKELGRIEVEGGARERRTVFYTALYHAFLCPNLYTDVDGRYRGMDDRIHAAGDYTHYTVFSLWDTYRALHPLFTIVQRERTVDFIKTLLNNYRQGGRLPVWELAANETDCMIGYHSVPVIADAYIKGIRDFDAQVALEAMKSSASRDHFGLEEYRKHGFIPSGSFGESVSRTLEYAYDDWCIAMMAREMGREGEHREFIIRAQFYLNLFDPVTRFMRARRNGGWLEPFDPSEVNFNYTEANSWQYSFYVPQDISSLIELHGGDRGFEDKLDRLFSEPSETGGLDLPDVSGMIGQYANGNEPSHHIAWLYSYVGNPSGTAGMVRKIAREMYSAGPDGYSGNEDCGQMSAWYIFSAMGFYPVTPGSRMYALGAPLFDEVTINLEGGGEFVIRADNLSGGNRYLNGIFLNGKPLSSPFLDHAGIVPGGSLVFRMGSSPERSWKSDRAVSRIEKPRLVPSPYLSPSRRVFAEDMEVVMECAEEGARIYYTTDGSDPSPGNHSAELYREPLYISENTTLRARAVAEGMVDSHPVTAVYHKLPSGITIDIINDYSSMYPASGDMALIDGIRGGEDFRTGLWQGYQGVDLDAVVDLGKVRDISSISAGFLQNQGSWIFLPVRVEYFISENGEDFKRVASLSHNVSPEREGAVTREFSAYGLDARGRYVKILAHNMGICPDWHLGRGRPAWIFADEVVID
ncbi:MAG: GH92 family glycosyl hydrolase [Candidatus Krumholzibacteriales bacterium]